MMQESRIKEACPICEHSALFFEALRINGVWGYVKKCRDGFCEFNDYSEAEKTEAFHIRDMITEE